MTKIIFYNKIPKICIKISVAFYFVIKIFYKAPAKKEVKTPAVAEKPKPAAAVTAGPKKAYGTPDKGFNANKKN